MPDLGEDHFLAAPKVNERETAEVGSEWVLTSRSTHSRTDDEEIKRASVVFELEPGDDPESDFHFFRVSSGTVHVQRDYQDARGCYFSIDHTMNISPGAANNYLRFDVSGTTPILKGFGDIATEVVTTTGSCGDRVNVKVGGVYFMTGETWVSGGSVHGRYSDDATTVIEWTLTRSR